MAVTKENLENLITTLNVLKIAYDNFIHGTNEYNDKVNKNNLNKILTKIKDVQKCDLKKTIDFFSNWKNNTQLINDIKL